MAGRNNHAETVSNTAVPAVEQSVTAAAGDQSRMCCAVGDLSCVVPVVAPPQGLPGERTASDAPRATEADESPAIPARE